MDLGKGKIATKAPRIFFGYYAASRYIESEDSRTAEL
jgi:hypothetical protein